MTSPLISVVDDDAAMCASLADLLRSAGYQAETFGSAEAFLRSEAAGRSQCVVTDIQMAGLSGLDLLEQLRAQELKTPIIVITALSEDHWATLAINSGAACFLRKPFEAAQFLSCVEKNLLA